MSLASRKLIQATAGATTVDTGDDDFANVVLLLDGDGTSGDNNETFTDSSTNGFTVTESGSVVQGSFSPYGNNWSNYFNGSSYLSVPDSTDFDFGTGDFTWEAWIRTTVNVNYQGVVGSYLSNSATWGIHTNSSGTITYFTAGTTIYTGSTVVTDDEWHHIAVSRSGTSIRLFVDGVQDGSTGTNSTNIANSAEVRIGSLSSGNLRYFTGYISNVRVIKGTALYTSAFTPSTSPLTAVTNTQLLISQSNRFVDNSSSSRTVTVGGTPKVTPFSPFKDSDARDITTDGGSGYFDLADTAYLSFSGGEPSVADMTISGWVYPKTMAPQAGNAYPRVFAAGGFLIYVRDDDIRIYNSGEKVQAPINNNEWTYFAAQRSSNTWTLYINGVSKGTASDSANIALNSTNYIGSNGASNYFTGYIADLRITTSGSTSTAVPTSPVSAVTNTELLLNFQDAGIYDRSGINNLDTVGNAQIDTAVTKYGTGSMEFDGSGDAIENLNADVVIGSGDFTVEAWVNFNSTNQDCIISTRLSTGTSNGFLFTAYLNKVQLFSGGSFILTGTTTLTTGQWYHVALTREGSTLRLFVDGSLEDSTTNSTNYSDTYLRVGRDVNSGYDFSGYMDDVRITKGVARYTANFTPPTAALPKF